MQINILCGGSLIGRAIVDASDPPMGVASGLFEPSLYYSRNAHAGEIEGVHNPTASDLTFTVQAGDGAPVKCMSVFIQDYSDSLGELQASIIGIPYPEYEARFGGYPAYQAYWGKS